MNNTKPTNLTLKLVRLCLDYRTPEHEAVAALRALRNERLAWHDVALSLAVSIKPQEKRLPPTNVMPFGKYKGHTITLIANDDPGYLRWVLENCRKISLPLRNQILQALASTRT